MPLTSQRVRPGPPVPLLSAWARGEAEATSMSHGERRDGPGRPATAQQPQDGTGTWRAWGRLGAGTGEGGGAYAILSTIKIPKIKILSPPKQTTKKQIPSPNGYASAVRTPPHAAAAEFGDESFTGKPLLFPPPPRPPDPPHSLPCFLPALLYEIPSLPSPTAWTPHTGLPLPSVFLCFALWPGLAPLRRAIVKSSRWGGCAGRWVLWFLSQVCQRLTCAELRKRQRQTNRPPPPPST